MTPNPPAFVTAAASFGPAATFMPASSTGCLILSMSVTVVLICSRRICQRVNKDTEIGETYEGTPSREIDRQQKGRCEENSVGKSS